MCSPEFDLTSITRKIFSSDYALSVTGFAGPEAEYKRVGLVYCCILGPDGYE
ncbi:unnamed protein product, partial [marine sediment metagenome]